MSSGAVYYSGGSVRNLPLINPELKAKKKGKYHNSGILSFETVKSVGTCPVYVCIYVCAIMTEELTYTSFRATPIDGFVDYIRGGCQMNLIVAIDFTVSDAPFLAPVLSTVQGGDVQLQYCMCMYMRTHHKKELLSMMCLCALANLPRAQMESPVTQTHCTIWPLTM